jgi:peptide/nickel transport system substrate-binding protein
VSDVEAGRADVLAAPQVLTAAQVEQLSTQGASQFHVGPSAATMGLVLNTRAWPFSVPAARQALNYAIDRDEIVTMLGGSALARPTCQILPPGLPGYQPYCPYTTDPSVTGGGSAPDLARAEQLVGASGTRGAKVTVLAGGFGTDIPVLPTGRYIVSVLDELGYNASLRVVADYGQYASALSNSENGAQIGWFGWYADYPAPWDFFGPLLTCSAFVPASDASLNMSEFCDRHADALEATALADQSRDPNIANTLWAQVDRYITDQAPWVPLWNPQNFVFLANRVGNYQFDPNLGALIDQLWVR